ncbi:thioesterase II family protein [Streptomyces mirabilis]|uniref:thioesterase II family protein n=1 Tax=Streptomyces mirabilis TaxID=68239 RepID=UPI003684DFB4
MLQQVPWLREFHTGQGSERTLVMFPHAGGSASSFRAYSAALSPRFRVLCVQYPGRQDRVRDALVDDVRKLARGVAADLARLDDRPPAFFGHSMGAVIAFEAARLLQEATGRGPARLFASGRAAPARPARSTAPLVHLMSDADLTAHLRQSTATDPRVAADADLLKSVLPPLRSDYRAIETYHCPPGRRIACPVTVLVGDQDPLVPLENAAAWTEHTSADCELLTFPGGDHFYLLPSHDRVIEVITDRLGRAPAPATADGNGRGTRYVQA